MVEFPEREEKKHVPVIAHTWNRLAAYGQQIALRFSSHEDFRSALEYIDSNAVLHDVPRAFLGDRTIVIPLEAVEHFRTTAVQFSEQSVISADDLPREELARLRREQAPF